MKLIFRYLARFKKTVVLAVFIKLLGTLAELTIPYIFEHIVDHVVPLGKLPPVILWGLAMFGAAILCRMLNVTANRKAVDNAHCISYEVRLKRCPV